MTEHVLNLPNTGDSLLLQHGNVAAVLTLALGLILCAFGYRFFTVVLALCGFVAGSILSATFTAAYFPDWTLVFSVAGGIVGAAMAVFILGLGIFLLGANLGCLVALVVAYATDTRPDALFMLILAMACGLGALLVVKPLIVFSTAFGGAWWVVTAGGYLAGLLPKGLMLGRLDDVAVVWDNVAWLVAAWFALAIAGAMVQYATAAKTDSNLLLPTQRHQEPTGANPTPA